MTLSFAPGSLWARSMSSSVMSRPGIRANSTDNQFIDVLCLSRTLTAGRPLATCTTAPAPARPSASAASAWPGARGTAPGGTARPVSGRGASRRAEWRGGRRARPVARRVKWVQLHLLRVPLRPLGLRLAPYVLWR